MDTALAATWLAALWLCLSLCVRPLRFQLRRRRALVGFSGGQERQGHD